MATKKEVAPVLVEWYDAETIAGWTGEDELIEYLKDFQPVLSVGWQFTVPDGCFDACVLYSEYDQTNKHLNRIQIIPSGMVVGVYPLSVSKATGKTPKSRGRQER